MSVQDTHQKRIAQTARLIESGKALARSANAAIFEHRASVVEMRANIAKMRSLQPRLGRDEAPAPLLSIITQPVQP